MKATYISIKNLKVSITSLPKPDNILNTLTPELSRKIIRDNFAEFEDSFIPVTDDTFVIITMLECIFKLRFTDPKKQISLYPKEYFDGVHAAPEGMTFEIRNEFEKNPAYDSIENQNRDNPILGFRKKVAIVTFTEPKKEVEDTIAQSLVKAQFGAPDTGNLIEDHMKDYFSRFKSYESQLSNLEWYQLYLDFYYKVENHLNVRFLKEEIVRKDEIIKMQSDTIHKHIDKLAAENKLNMK